MGTEKNVKNLRGKISLLLVPAGTSKIIRSQVVANCSLLDEDAQNLLEKEETNTHITHRERQKKRNQWLFIL